MNAWQCERCRGVTQQGDAETLPDGWMRISIGVRGIDDATNRHDERSWEIICGRCDDHLYDWYYARAIEGET